ncbi:PIN domain-containing protein [Candidatus Woesearchaeota archaeon]|nr:PIN domain-containing protein [Candidatus Woesearchaeota archaeon]
MIADTSFLVALFLAEDELHDKALGNLINYKQEKIIIPDRVLEETFTVLVYKKDINYALEVIDKLGKNNDIILYRIEEVDWTAIIRLVNKVKKKLSFVDYSVIYLCIKNGEKALCFDNEINKIVNRY